MQLKELERKLQLQVLELGKIPQNKVTMGDLTFKRQLQDRLVEIYEQMNMHHEREKSRARWVDGLFVHLYRWSQGYPKGMYEKISAENL